MQIPTVKIVDGDGYSVINEADYNSDVHQLVGEPQPVPTRDDIAAMKKADLIEWLAEFNVSGVDAMKVPELRKRLTSEMFLDA